MRQLVYTTFISNNRTSFHLWWKENLLKHRKVSKYYETDRSLRKFSSFVTIKCVPTFLSLLVSVLDLVLFFTNSVKLCGLKFEHFTIHCPSDFIFYKMVYQFQKRLNSFLYFNVFFLFRNTTIFFNILRFMKQWRMLGLPYFTKFVC